jgi:hypothetical protein
VGKLAVALVDVQAVADDEAILDLEATEGAGRSRFLRSSKVPRRSPCR